MFCRKCGKTVPNDSKFCPYCGETVTTGEESPKEHGSCKNCGNPLPGGKLFGLCDDCLSRSGIETAEYGRCENCGKSLEPDDGTLCKECAQKLVEAHSQSGEQKYGTQYEDFYRPKKHGGAIVAVLAVIAIVCVGIYYSHLDSAVSASTSSSSEASLPTTSSASSAPLSVRTETIYNDFQTIIQGNVEDTIKEKLKRPDTATFDYDMTKLSANNAIFTCLGNVSYTNAKGQSSKDDFTVSLIATEKVYYPLYVKLGSTVSIDNRKGTNSLGIATSSGNIFGKVEGESIFDSSDGNLILVSDEINQKMSLDEYSRIKTGMSYAAVTEIVGSYGNQESYSEISGYTGSIYTWDGNGSAGSNANVSFQNGRVIAKAQIGLQ